MSVSVCYVLLYRDSKPLILVMKDIRNQKILIMRRVILYNLHKNSDRAP